MMKTIKDLEGIDQSSLTILREQAIQNVREILIHHKTLRPEMIDAVGIIENGQLQIKVPTDISKIGVVKLVGYLKWFWDIKDEEVWKIKRKSM